ncbi:MAG: DUF4870 domain-containing protein [Pseudomonadota bacterium]
MNDQDNAPGPTESNREAQQWGMFAHLSALIGFVIPFGNVIGPLVVWQMKKDDNFIADQGKEALNFQITVTLAVFACLLLSLIVIGMLLLPVVGLAALVLTIIGGVKANGGERYRYPFALRLVT